MYCFVQILKLNEGPPKNYYTYICSLYRSHFVLKVKPSVEHNEFCVVRVSVRVHVCLEEGFTGDSFLLLESENMKELGLKMGGRLQLSKLVKEASFSTEVSLVMSLAMY